MNRNSIYGFGLAWFLIALLLLGCSGTQDWTATEPLEADRGEILDQAVDVLRRYEFYVETIDREEGKIETGWNFRPTIHSHSGMRRKVEISVEPADGEQEGESDRWIARLRCLRERNDNVIDPMNYYSADWTPMGRDVEYELLLSGFLYMALRDPSEFGMSEELVRDLDTERSRNAEQRKLEREIAEHEREIAELEAEKKELEQKMHAEETDLDSSR